MINLILIDDHEIIYDGLRSIFEDIKNINLVGFARNLSDAKNLVDDNIDIAIVDVEIGYESGIELIYKLREKYSSLKIIGFSMHFNTETIFAIMKAGAHGFVDKQSGSKKLLRAIEKVRKGEKFFEDFDASNILKALDISKELNLYDVLTEREIEIFKNLALGTTVQEISKNLYITKSTVETHKRNIMKKLNLANTAELVKLAIKQKLIAV